MKAPQRLNHPGSPGSGPPSERFYDTQTAASIMRTSVDAVREMCRSGVLRGAVKDRGSGRWLIPATALSDWPAGEGETEGGGDSYHFSDVDRSVIAAGRGAQVSIRSGSSEESIRRAFEPIYRQIHDLPEEKAPEREMIADTVKDIEAEVVKKEEADESKLARGFKLLAVMAPDILEVTIDTILNPLKGISTVVRKIAERAQAESAE